MSDSPQPAYVLGQLAANAEAAGARLNVAVRLACSVQPARGFPQMLHSYHRLAVERRRPYETRIAELMAALPEELPQQVPDNGLFDLGYYHERPRLCRERPA